MPPVKRKPKDAAKVAPQAAAKVSIDFPREGEQVLPGHYAVRVTAQGADGVEVSINGGPWQPCRTAAGHHWFDWAPSAPGLQVIAARPKAAGARARGAVQRTCSVKESSLN